MKGLETNSLVLCKQSTIFQAHEEEEDDQSLKLALRQPWV